MGFVHQYLFSRSLLLLHERLARLAKSVNHAGLQHLFAVAEPFFGEHDLMPQMGERLTAPIFQLATLEKIPHALLWVQLRGIPRKTLQMESPGCPGSEKIAF